MTDPRARLRELEKRLKDEPENLGLRVMVAGVLRDAGRGAEAVELYRSVAIAYRDQGRSQQAIAVCKSILEVAPDDQRCHALLEALVKPVEPDDVEPLPPQPEGPPSTRRTGPYAVASGTTPGEVKREATPKPIAEPKREPTPKPVSSDPTRAPTPKPVITEPETPRLEPPPPRLRAASLTPPKPVPVAKGSSTGPVPKIPSSTGPVPKIPSSSAPVSRPATPPTPAPVPKTPPPAATTPKTPRPGSIIAVGTTPPTKRRATEQATEVRKKSDSATAHVIRREESSPVRRTPFEATPLPQPMPHHIADPTTSSNKKLSESDLPVSEGAETRPGSEPGTRPEMSGIASAARRISASLIASADASGLLDEDDLSAQLDTRQMPRIESSEFRKLDAPPPTVPTERIDLVLEEITPPPLDTPLHPIPVERDSEDERTRPRDMPLGLATSSERAAAAQRPWSAASGETIDDLAASSLFASLPTRQRAGVLARFLPRSVKAGVAVIRQGESGHPLIVVVRGKLSMICERIDGTILPIGSVGAGEFVGEAALLAHVPSPVQVVAATDVELRVLAAKELYEIAGAFPSMWTILREAADRRTRELEGKLRR